MDMLAFPFLCKNPAVFARENPRILFMAKRQKAQEAVHTPFRLRTSDCFYFSVFFARVLQGLFSDFSDFSALSVISLQCSSPFTIS